jgi:hypothetical protein
MSNWTWSLEMDGQVFPLRNREFKYNARNMRFLILSFLLFMFLPTANGQVRTFRWNTELCRFSGTYDSKKFSQAQLENTVRLMRPGEFGLDPKATVWNFNEIADLDPAALDRKYEMAISELKQLKIVSSAFWESVRRNKTREIEQVYRLSRATMLGYKDPAKLRDYGGAESCKAKFAEPLIAGGDRLLAAWRVVSDDSRKRNSDPERLRRIFDEQMASPDRLKFALIEVMSFGWWNCANEFIEYDGGDNSPAREREFRKLFIRVRNLGCDEP